MAKIEAGNLYDFNKELVEKYEKQFNKEQLIEKINNEFEPFVKKEIDNNHEYFMLLCHERRDYTIFVIKQNLFSSLEDRLIEAKNIFKKCLTNRGPVYSLEPTLDNTAIEVWLKDFVNGELYCYFFFPCDKMIAEITGENIWEKKES